jgi:hypothetical protein
MYMLCEGNADTSCAHINKHSPVRDLYFDEHVTNQLTTDRQHGVSGTGQAQAISRSPSSCNVTSVTVADGFTSRLCNQLHMSPSNQNKILLI